MSNRRASFEDLDDEAFRARLEPLAKVVLPGPGGSPPGIATPTNARRGSGWPGLLLAACAGAVCSATLGAGYYVFTLPPARETQSPAPPAIPGVAPGVAVASHPPAVVSLPAPASTSDRPASTPDRPATTPIAPAPDPQAAATVHQAAAAQPGPAEARAPAAPATAASPQRTPTPRLPTLDPAGLHETPQSGGASQAGTAVAAHAAAAPGQLAAPAPPPAAAPVQLAAPAPPPAAAASSTGTRTAASSTPKPPAHTALSPVLLHDLVQRGAAALAIGDVAAARMLYESAAAAGSGVAARQLARTYDTGFLRRIGADGVSPDEALAAKWRRRAEALDAEEGQTSRAAVRGDQ